MQTDTLFVVLAHRSARSVFGASTNPVMRNGRLLCFKAEEEARFERDRLNARIGAGSHVRYSVKPIHVELRRPNEVAKAQSAESQHAASLYNGSRAAAPRRDAWKRWWARPGSNQ